jgi:hypothetical protein
MTTEANADGADDLEILHPEREIEIAGRKIVMREYGGVEGIRLAGAAAPVVHDLAALTSADKGGDMLAYLNLQAVFAKHVDAITGMVAQACDQPRAWVESLGDADLQTLLVTWWAVNGPFFVRRVVQTVQMQMATGAFAGAKSTAFSPPTTTTSRDSGTTRAVN